MIRHWSLSQRLLELGKVLKREYYSDPGAPSVDFQIEIYLDPEIKRIRVPYSLKDLIRIEVILKGFCIFRIEEVSGELNIKGKGPFQFWKPSQESLYMRLEPDRVIAHKGLLIEETLEETGRRIVIWSLKEALFGQGWIRRSPLGDPLWMCLFSKGKYPSFLHRMLISRIPRAFIRRMGE